MFMILPLHRYLNALETTGGAHWLAESVESENISSWSDPLDVLAIGICQLGLSGWQPEECSAIGNELAAWKSKGLPDREGRLFPFFMWKLLEIFEDGIFCFTFFSFHS